MQNLSYIEQIHREIAESCKMRNSARLFYYHQALAKSAVASWETFTGSWAGQQWLNTNATAINAHRDEQNRRFGYMGIWQ